MDVDRLESIAQQFVGRVHDDDPHANRRWLHSVTTDEERDALLFVLAAAVPIDRKWTDLTEWCNGSVIERRRRQWRESKQRTRGAA